MCCSSTGYSLRCPPRPIWALRWPPEMVSLSNKTSTTRFRGPWASSVFTNASAAAARRFARRYEWFTTLLGSISIMQPIHRTVMQGLCFEILQSPLEHTSFSFCVSGSKGVRARRQRLQGPGAIGINMETGGYLKTHATYLKSKSRG